MRSFVSICFNALILLALPLLAIAQPVVVNSSFETDLASDWQIWVGAGSNSDSLERDYTPSGHPDGVYALAVKGLGAGGKGAFQYIASGWQTNHNYRVSAWAKNLVNSGMDYSVGYTLGNGGSGSGPSATYGTSANNPSSWTEITVQFTYSGSSGATLYLRAVNAGFPERAGFDKVTITDLGLAGPTFTPTPLPSPTPTITPGGPTITPTPAVNPTPWTPTSPVWGMTMVLGESIVAPGWVHDDLGPPMDKIVQIYRDSAATAISAGFCDWARMEPNDPGSGASTYDWTLLQAATDPFVPLIQEGRLGIAYASFNVPSWLDGQYDTTRYWQLAERYMEAFARQMNQRGIYYFVFENEPNLLARSDWAPYYMGRLQHAYTAIKAADSRNQVIAGNLAERAAASGHFDILYNNGLKNYSDIIGTHPYSNDPLTGVDLNDVILLHQQMVARGDGNKKIFLGEGWGPKRDVPGIGRGSAADRPNRAEIDRLQDFVLNGYHNLNTPTGNYDPNWLLGGLFFTFNDNLGALHWADRATPVAGGCLIDGYFIGGCNTDPQHHNGGIIDFYGNPKRDLIWKFPDGTPRPSPTPVPNPPSVGSNLLLNGDFEGGFTNNVANNWLRFDTTATGMWEQRAGRTGGSAQAFGEDDVGFNGGIMQTFPTTPGKWYGISSWISYEFQNQNNPDIMIAVGWDPTGQTASPRAFSMVWSMDYIEAFWQPDTWYHVEHLFQATSSQASVWFWAGQEWAAPRFFAVVDDVSVTEVQPPVGPTVTPTQPTTPTVTPTVTPMLTVTPTLPPSSSNLLVNPSFELSSGTSHPGWSGIEYDVGQTFPDPHAAQDGAKWVGHSYGGGAQNIRELVQTVSVTPGEPCVLSAWTFAGGLYGNVTPSLRWYDGNYSGTGSAEVDSVTWTEGSPEITWTRLSGQVTPTSSQLTFILRIEVNGWGAGANFDDCSLVSLATNTPTPTASPTGTPTATSTPSPSPSPTPTHVPYGAHMSVF